MWYPGWDPETKRILSTNLGNLNNNVYNSANKNVSILVYQL